jgi:hypothetical protein
VDGEPVCWSATHLSGTMAMIYTPEEHRRKGYAKSLAAFQIDHMLEKDGVACCHIISTNTASNELVKNFGFSGGRAWSGATSGPNLSAIEYASRRTWRSCPAISSCIP